MFAIYKRELKTYFNSMIGFVFLAFFLIIIGLYTWAYNFSYGIGNFEVTLNQVAFLFILLIPILTMRIVSEDYRQKTDQMLLTAPVSITQVVMGKYLAVLSLFLIGVAVISIYPAVIASYGTDVRLVLAYGGILGFALLGASYIAIGMFISSLTESQLIAAVLSFVVMLLCYLVPGLSSMLPTSAISQLLIVVIGILILCFAFYNMTQNEVLTIALAIVAEAAAIIVYAVKSSLYEGLISKILDWLAVSDRYNNFAMGILDYSALLYYLSIIFIFNFLTVQVMTKKKFN